MANRIRYQLRPVPLRKRYVLVCQPGCSASLAAHFGVDAEPTTSIVCVDRKRQWRRFGNIRRSRILAALAHPLCR